MSENNENENNVAMQYDVPTTQPAMILGWFSSEKQSKANSLSELLPQLESEELLAILSMPSMLQSIDVSELLELSDE